MQLITHTLLNKHKKKVINKSQTQMRNNYIIKSNTNQEKKNTVKKNTQKIHNINET